MPNELIALISPLVSGVVVAFLSYFLTRRRDAAETEKLRAEAEELRAQAEQIRIEIGQLHSSVEEVSYHMPTNETIIYDGTRGIGGYDISVSDSHDLKHGTLFLQRGRGEIILCKYIYDGRERDFLPRNELLSGERKLRVSWEARVIEGSCELMVQLRQKEGDGELAATRLTIHESDWKKLDLYFRIPPDKNCYLKMLTRPLSDRSSIQMRNLVVAERTD